MSPDPLLASVDSVISQLRGHELVVLGEGVELFSVAVPTSLAGRPLLVCARARRQPRHWIIGETQLDEGAVLIMLGNLEQRRKFAELFERAS